MPQIMELFHSVYIVQSESATILLCYIGYLFQCHLVVALVTKIIHIDTVYHPVLSVTSGMVIDTYLWSIMKGEALIHNSWYPNLQIAEGELHNKKGISKHHKTDEKAPILRCTFPHQDLDFSLNIPPHSAPFQKCSGVTNINTNVDGETCTTVLSFFWFGSNTKIYLSLCRALIFNLVLV